jgi:hypothetical protein
MVSFAGSNEEEDDLALALRLSQLSSDAFDKKVVQLHREGLASAERTSRPATDREGDLTLDLDAPRQYHGTAEEQRTPLHSIRSAGGEASQITPGNDDLELALRLSQLPVDLFDEQVEVLNQQTQSQTVDQDSLPSLLTEMSLSEVQVSLSLCLI